MIFFPGDDGNALLNILSADSWHDVFDGKVSFRQNRIYYPFPYGRSFTDLSLSLYLLAIPWKLLKCDTFSSVLAVYITLYTFGFFSMFYLNRKICNFSLPASLCGTAFPFFSSAYFVKLAHTQFFFMSLLPLLAICVIRSGENWIERNPVKLILWTTGVSAVFSCIALSNYYTAFFAGIFSLLCLIIAAANKDFRKHISSEAIRQRMPETTASVLLFLLMMSPFLYIYYPAMGDSYSRNWEAAQGTLPVLSDIANIGKNNLLWGKLYDLFFPPIHKHVYENCYGLPPLTLLATVILSVIYWKNKKFHTAWISILWLSLALMYLLSLKVWHGISLWYFVWKYFPGGSAIRAGGRIYVFMIFPLAVFMAYMIDKISVFKSKGIKICTLSVVLVLFAADNHSGFDLFKWSCSGIRERIAKIPAPPAEIKVFYITDSRGGAPSEANWGKYGMAAWLIARHHQIFSINGCSGNAPLNFYALDPLASDYRQAVIKWIQDNGLKNVGHFDTATNSWHLEQ